MWFQQFLELGRIGANAVWKCVPVGKTIMRECTLAGRTSCMAVVEMGCRMTEASSVVVCWLLCLLYRAQQFTHDTYKDRSFAAMIDRRVNTFSSAFLPSINLISRFEQSTGTSFRHWLHFRTLRAYFAPLFLAKAHESIGMSIRHNANILDFQLFAAKRR